MAMKRSQLKKIRRAKEIRRRRNIERAKRKAEGTSGFGLMLANTRPNTNKHAYRLYNI